MRPWRIYADMGNSALHWAISGPQGWLRAVRVVFDQNGVPHDTAVGIRVVLERTECDPRQFAGAALVSSNPNMTDHAREALAAVVGEVVVLGRDLTSDLTIDYDEPERIGQDRIAAVEGARLLRGAPVAVLSCGSCLTAQALTAEGVMIAGGIAPGLGACAEGVAAAAPHLADLARNAVDRGIEIVFERLDLPDPPRNTLDNLVWGVLAAYTGAAQYLAVGLLDQSGARDPVLLTGAGAHIIDQLAGGEWQDEPLLVFEGLRAVHERWLGET